MSEQEDSDRQRYKINYPLNSWSIYISGNVKFTEYEDDLLPH
jgi:hypothetical protein